MRLLYGVGDWCGCGRHAWGRVPVFNEVAIGDAGPDGLQFGYITTVHGAMLLGTQP